MKCVNIPETNDSVVSPVIVKDTASNFWASFFVEIVAKPFKMDGVS